MARMKGGDNADFAYAKKYGIGAPKMSGTGRPGNWYDDEGNDDQDAQAAFKAEIAGHRANNYDLRRAEGLVQDSKFRDELEGQGFDKKLLTQTAGGNSVAAENFLREYGAKMGTHNNRGEFDLNDTRGAGNALANDQRKFERARIDDTYVNQKSFSKFKDSQQTSSAVLPEPAELSERSQAARDYLTDKRNDFGLGDDSGIFKSRFGGDFMDTRAAEQGEYPRQTTPSDESTDGLAPGTSDVAVSESAIDNTNEQAAKNMKDDYSFNVKGALKLAGVSTRGPGTKFGA